MAAKIKKGDKVIVLAGKDKGKTGEITEMLIKQQKVLVRGLNMVKRHTKPSRTNEGGIVAKEMPLHISNVALVDPKTGGATRVGFTTNDKGKKVRVTKRSGALIV